MPLCDGPLIHTEVRDDVPGAAAEPAGDGSLLDTPALILGDAQQPAAPFTKHSRSQSTARRSNQAVNWRPGSAQGTAICLIL